ncbi:alpha/beta fold hydrolase [Streptosporangium carneum]|uniref:AB hydrolase-1 domain-containing protein n=1 Tax=Streptosporangium carneum TaxID=47481 RepID=A0A9W6HXH6_9ACTN|nr:alpha/beta fold hydrolase [Streptosporangium carneum]GLK07204.1 hypothetical protein GCM10017600_06090 [Streptosporangium carneum]
MPSTETTAPSGKAARGAAPVPVTRARATRLGRAAFGALAAMVMALSTTAAGASAVPGGGAHAPAGFPAGFRGGKVAVDGGAVHYVRGGSGPAVVLLHGWPETSLMWRKVMPGLARNHTVVAIDLPGLGGSDIPNGGYDKVTAAHRVRQAVNALGLGQVEILAHDIGVLVAYPYARDFPGEVRRLVMIEAPLAGFGLEDLYGVSWHLRFNSSPAPIPEKIVDNDDVSTYLGMMFDFSHRPEAIEREPYYRAYASPARRTASYEYYRAFAGDAVNNRANAARRLPMPVLAVGGQHSFGARVADSFRQVADDVRPVVVPDSGHFVPEENPGFVTDCASLFLGAPNGAPQRPELAPCAP